MTSRFTFIFLAFALILISQTDLLAQHNAAEAKSTLIVKKDIAFIVRKSDKVKNIAARFHVPFALFARLNTPIRKKQTVYAGKKLVMPVWLRKKNPAQPDTEFNLADYELATDSLDTYVREDFISVAEIEADTMRRVAISKELKKIDKKIYMLNLLLDSIEEDGRQNLSKRDATKLPMNRARRIGYFSPGLQVDSLIKQKQKLSDEKTKIDLAIADYEYLLENADYMSSHHNKKNPANIEIKEWGDDPDKSNTKPKYQH